MSPRDSHARYAGHVYAKDDPVWHSIFPPSDFGCKCSVEDCDAPPESGFAFDPAHAFEKFDYDAIKDAELREKTRDGVERILGAGSPTSQTGPTSPTEPAETHEEHLARRKEQLARAKENRVKREAELLGADMIKGEHTREQDLAATNPNFVQGRDGEWENNCQRCVTTYEARRRGIDVEALPYIEKTDGTFSCMFLDGKLNPDGWTSAYQNPRSIYCGAKDGVSTGVKVARQLEEWGDGARAIVRVRWKDEDGGGGHVFIAENVNGEVKFIDPQNNDLDMSGCFSSVKNHETYVIRVDNLKFRDNVRKCCRKKDK